MARETMSKQLLASLSLVSLSTCGALADTYTGDCTLEYDKRGRAVSHQLDLGQVVLGVCEFKLMEFGGALAITANGEFENTGDVTMKFAYYASFFDKKGKLIGSAGFAAWDKYSALQPGKRSRPSSCIIRIPDSMRNATASYQVAFYEEESSARDKDERKRNDLDKEKPSSP